MRAWRVERRGMSVAQKPAGFGRSVVGAAGAALCTSASASEPRCARSTFHHAGEAVSSQGHGVRQTLGAQLKLWASEVRESMYCWHLFEFDLKSLAAFGQKPSRN